MRLAAQNDFRACASLTSTPTQAPRALGQQGSRNSFTVLVHGRGRCRRDHRLLLRVDEGEGRRLEFQFRCVDVGVGEGHVRRRRRVYWIGGVDLSFVGELVRLPRL